MAQAQLLQHRKVYTGLIYTSVSYIVCNGLFMSRPHRNRSEPLLVWEIRWSIVIRLLALDCTSTSASSCGSVLISVEQVCTSRRGIESGFLKSTMSKLVLREKGYCPACTRRNVPLCKLCNLFLVNRLLRDKMLDKSEFENPWTRISKHCQRWWIMVGCILKYKYPG